MTPVPTNIPWKLIGAGVLILTIIVAALGLINYGQKLEKLKTVNKALKAELEEAIAWKDTTIALLNEQKASIETWQTTANDFEIAYQAALARQPQVVYRDVIRRVTEEIPSGDCDVAAVASWHLLREAGLLEGVPP